VDAGAEASEPADTGAVGVRAELIDEDEDLYPFGGLAPDEIELSDSRTGVSGSDVANERIRASASRVPYRFYMPPLAPI
jgi:hypothetical protein